MQTLMMSDTEGHPWMEFTPSHGGPSQRVELTKFPFTIGRDESTDFCVDSARVSREHVAIEKGEEGKLILRDLGSTNGTAVNGKMIFEVELNDGDALLIADFPMTFRLPSGEGKISNATQVISTPLTGSSSSGSSGKHVGLIWFATFDGSARW